MAPKAVDPSWLTPAPVTCIRSIMPCAAWDITSKSPSDPADLRQGGRVILPGWAHLQPSCTGCRQRGLVEALIDVVRRGDPLLGICVGMQALFTLGEEMGQHPGLDLLPGKVVRFPQFNRPQSPAYRLESTLV
jgi:imidazoleglycerol phosphate synthase glutamine amidotransferase subunit HisH